MVLSVKSIWRRWLKNCGRRRRVSAHEISRSWAAQVLEDRVLLSTITVTSASDATGAHAGVTLRDAVNLANQLSGADTIVFDSSLDGTAIRLAQGELNITDTLTIRGNGAGSTIVDGQGQSRVFDVESGNINLTFDGLTVTGGKTTASIDAGGGISFLSTGSLTVMNSAIVGNSTTGTGSTGGAIHATVGSVTVLNSTLSGNKTLGKLSSGGAIYTSTGAITLTNSTVSGNTTAGESSFGGALSSTFGSVTLVSTTLAKNATTGQFASGGGIYARLGAVRFTNSIVAQNTIVNGGYPDIFTDFTKGANVTLDHSLLGNKQGTLLVAAPVGSPDAKGNLIGATWGPIDPKLGALADNGGETQTMTLLAGSPALNMGGSSGLQFDQRGNPFVRVANGAVDMGAFEFSTTTPPTARTVSLTVSSLSVDPETMAEAGGQSTITATLSAVSSLDTTITLAFSGTATLGSDYNRSAATIVIPAGQRTGSITLTALADSLVEGSETAVVDINSVTNAVENGVQRVTATIVEAAPPSNPSVTLSVSPATMNEDGGQSIVTARLSAVSSLDTTIVLGCSGTAALGVDYGRSGKRIVIPAGQLSGSVTLTAFQDSLAEGTETVVVDINTVTNGVESGVQRVTANLTNAAPVQLVASQSASPGVTLAISPATMAEAGGRSIVTATLSAVSNVDTTIGLEFSGTGTFNSDYARSAKRIIIPAGKLSGSITLTSFEDSLGEGTETVVVDIDTVIDGVEDGVQRVTANLLDAVFADPESSFVA